MRFEDSKYSQNLDYKKVTLSSGNFYFLKKIVIAEINEGVHYDWNKTMEWSQIAIEYYGNDIKIGYISNRVNPYSIDPQLYTTFDEEYGFVVASAIVIYNDISYVNASIEKKFSKNRIKRCRSLKEAIEWIGNLKEFKKEDSII